MQEDSELRIIYTYVKSVLDKNGLLIIKMVILL